MLHSHSARHLGTSQHVTCLYVISFVNSLAVLCWTRPLLKAFTHEGRVELNDTKMQNTRLRISCIKTIHTGSDANLRQLQHFFNKRFE